MVVSSQMAKKTVKNAWTNAGITFGSPVLLEAAKRAAHEDDRSLSAYVRQLIKDDLTSRGLWPPEENSRSSSLKVAETRARYSTAKKKKSKK